MVGGGFADKVTGRMGVEGIRCIAHDTDHVSEYLFSTGGVFEGGALSTLARERQGGNTPRDKVNRQDPHALRHRIPGMGNEGGEPPPGWGAVVWREEVG